MALNTVVPVVMVAGYAPAATGALYTVPAGKKTVLKDFWIANSDTVAHTITMRITPSGQASSDAYNQFKNFPLAAAGSPGANMQAGCSLNMLAGDFLELIADVANKVSCRFSGVEVS